MMTSWFRSVLAVAVLSTLAFTSSADVGEDERTRFIMGRKVEVISGSDGVMVGDRRVMISLEMIPTDIQVENSSTEEVSTSSVAENISQRAKEGSHDEQYHGTRGSVQRQTQDIDDILNDMASRDPSEWSAVEWFIMVLFLSFIGWLGCCLCTLCCCGGSSTDILGYLCLWEICCRGGEDIDRCCDYGLA